MKPYFETLSIPEGQSCLIYDRRMPEFGFNWHFHPQYELTLTLGSSGTRFVGGDVAPYGDGDLVLVGPDLPHAWHSHQLVEDAVEHRALICWFEPCWIARLQDLMPELTALAPLLTEARGGVRFGPDAAVQERILALAGMPPAQQGLALAGILLDLAGHAERHVLSPCGPDTAPPSQDRRRMEAVLTHLHAHVASPLRLAPLCDLAHLTPSQLQRIFKRSTGLSISAYIARLRVGQAATLLTGTELPLSQIAERCGFYDSAHMSRIFRERTGRSPSAHRRASRSHGEPLPAGVFPMRRPDR